MSLRWPDTVRRGGNGRGDLVIDTLVGLNPRHRRGLVLERADRESILRNYHTKVEFLERHAAEQAAYLSGISIDEVVWYQQLRNTAHMDDPIEQKGCCPDAVRPTRAMAWTTFGRERQIPGSRRFLAAKSTAPPSLRATLFALEDPAFADVLVSERCDGDCQRQVVWSDAIDTDRAEVVRA
jgi:hypothetical protein